MNVVRHYRLTLGLATLCVTLLSLRAGADTITLNNGTTIQGTVMKQGDKYWVKPPDGESRLIPADEVKSVVKGNGGATPAGPRGSTPEFLKLKAKIELVLISRDAVSMWKAFIDTHPGSADLPAAQAEMERWAKLAADRTEKIYGRWIGGAELKALVDKADAIAKIGADEMKANRSIQAIEKFKEAVKIYPNDYVANYMLGYLSLVAKKNDEAVSYFEQALRLKPESAGAVSNLAIALWESHKTDRAMALFLQAVQTEDSLALARNVLAASNFALRDLAMAGKYKEVTSAANLLASKYHLEIASETRFWLQPPSGTGGGRATGGGSGSGFIISPDGLILTNRHVASIGNKIMVRLADGSEKPAEVVMIDTTQDLALLRIHPDAALPAMAFSNSNLPNEGALCYALGFPLIDRMGASLKITQGIVSGLRPTEAADIVIDAKVNPGNSGGPLVNKYGQVIGIVTLKSRSSEMEDSYGIAVSSGKIRQFLSENHVTARSGTTTADLSAEEIVTKIKPSTVCILVTQGPATRPAGQAGPAK